jgi:hypothetical protein
MKYFTLQKCYCYEAKQRFFLITISIICIIKYFPSTKVFGAFLNGIKFHDRDTKAALNGDRPTGGKVLNILIIRK